MMPFDYYRPATLPEAEKLLVANDDSTLLAGGMTLLPTLKMRLAQPSVLIDLGSIKSLAGVREQDGYVEIGAMMTHGEVAGHPIIREKIPALALLAGNIGDPQVRNRGTLGGSVANSDPAADYPAAVLGLNAIIVTQKREIVADEFFLEMFETALEPAEIITAIRFPVAGSAAYEKFANPASGYAIAGVMVVRSSGGIRVAVTGVASCVFRQQEMEAALDKNFAPAALVDIAVSSAGFNSDMHASPEYRADLVKVLAQRAVVAAQG
ncbi:MAG: xanthine dehydrogenase family protein subunit M [Woeseia sp.]|nr:xanthine dehydrogenase family protein subunit M [Woeseia sp.]MBT8097782.1 xanthine dehydrogenase family protein subunit M [Woeseia sp.]NNE60521.1 xanthine dehydrogenase family protein subunit M [Woeseia sp.]NNL54887.1 xanthine dehydrogenase family protein subunit M [Woeseia sp.]